MIVYCFVTHVLFVIHFCVPFSGSLLLFQPEVYLTIIAHTPFFKSQSQQVLVQGWLLMVRNLDEFLASIYSKLIMLEAQLAEVRINHLNTVL